MSVVALSPIEHDGTRYEKGQTLSGTPEQEKVLVEGGVAMLVGDVPAAAAEAPIEAPVEVSEPTPEVAPEQETPVEPTEPQPVAVKVAR